MTPVSALALRLTTAKACLPGDTLVLGTLSRGWVPVFGDMAMTDIQAPQFYVAADTRALVIRRVVTEHHCWVFVLCDERLGWVNFYSIDSLEPAS